MPEIIPDLVSTIIPVFNRPEMLVEAVHSVLSQTYRPIEVIIADDASTDDTPVVGAELESQHPGVVRLIRSEQNAGCGPGPMRELGRQHACGEFIQYLDSDDRLLPDKFRLQVELLRRHPECDIAYGITRLVDEQNRVLADPFKWTGREISQLYPGLLVDRWWCTHTPLYRRSLTDRIGPWSVLRWSQDWEYDSRAGGLGVRVMSCGQPVSEHRHHTGVRQTSEADWARDPVRLRNRVELLNALLKQAEHAGVPESAPERQHFARWSFTIARQCAAAGLSMEMNQLLKLALRAAGSDGPGAKGVAVFGWLASLLGGRNAGWLAQFIANWKKKPGKATLLQSFSRETTE